MTDQEVWGKLESLYAYDVGSVDSGVHDEALRLRCYAYVETMEEDTVRLSLSRFLRDVYLSEEGLAQGYGVEDVHGFLQWLSEQGVWEF